MLLTLITTAILIGYLFGKSVLDHKASVHAEEHRAFGVFGDVVEVPAGFGRLPSGPGCHRFAAESEEVSALRVGIPDAEGLASLAASKSQAGEGRARPAASQRTSHGLALHNGSAL